jgi:hypothetical protein
MKFGCSLSCGVDAIAGEATPARKGTLMPKLTGLSSLYDRSQDSQAARNTLFEAAGSKPTSEAGTRVRRPRLWVLVCVILLLIIAAFLIELHIRELEHPPFPHPPAVVIASLSRC